MENFEIQKYSNSLSIIKKLLSYPYINFVSQYFSLLRDYEACLRFVDFCYIIIGSGRNQLTAKEFEEFNRVLVLYELFSLDGLNEWIKYIELYEKMERESQYKLPYWRYNIIKRKKLRQSFGKPTEHLKHHRQLTTEQLNSRYAELLGLLERIYKGESSCRKDN